MKIKELHPVYVPHFPEKLEGGVLYVSEEFKSAAHLCCCGCGEEVITPLNAANWRLSKSGGKVSLFPSIGNWKYPCKSHYWIRNNRIVDAPPLSSRLQGIVIHKDRAVKVAHAMRLTHGAGPKAVEVPVRPSAWDRLFKWLKAFGR